MSVAILIPVLKRPDRAAPLVASIEAATPEPHRVVFICTEDDLAEQEACRATGATVLVLPGPRESGDYSRKINYGYRHTTEPVLFLGADDITFTPGWYSTAAALVSDQIQVVGTNDLGNQRVMNGDHSTHTLVTRKYVDEQGTLDGPGEVLHEGYGHWYCDDEFIQTAQKRDAFAPCLESIVEHFHYYWKKTPRDETYRLGEQNKNADKRLYLERRAILDRPDHKIALAVIGDGRLDYLATALASADEHLEYSFVAGFMVDDSGDIQVRRTLKRAYPQFRRINHRERQGLAAAVNSAWDAALETDAEYLFHLEGDFTFAEDVDLDAMCRLLEEQPHLAHVVLKRQAWSPPEVKAGGYIELSPESYTDCDGWVEHDRLFSLNPSVIRREVLELGPFVDEADFSARCKRAGYRFAIWGQKADPPRVLHIGQSRHKAWVA